MTRSTIRRTLVFLGFTTLAPMFVLGCPKKEQPVVEEAAAPPPPPPTASVTELAPMTDDAGPDADAAPEAGKKVYGGGGYNSNQLKIRECCNALRAQVKQLGTAPEAAQVNMAAQTCDMLVVQMGATGTAPEMAGVRQMLKSVKLPSVCQQ
jgi:hypothetical protein